MIKKKINQLAETHFKGNQESLENFILKQIEQNYNYGIISIIDKGDFALFQTCYVDSSFQELLHSNKEYFDNRNKSIDLQSENVVYGKCYIIGFLKKSVIEDFQKISPLISLGENVYYYRKKIDLDMYSFGSMP